MNSTETMRREHRRVAATSWLDTNENDMPPLKPTRTVNDIGNTILTFICLPCIH